MIRLARAEDIPRLQELLGQILLVHHYARPDVFKSEGRKFTDAELEVSDNNGPLKAVKTLFIDDLCVDKEARGQKLGEKLYQFALDYAKESGCYNLTLHVWNDNEGAVRFYERLGMKPRYTEMETILK